MLPRLQKHNMPHKVVYILRLAGICLHACNVPTPWVETTGHGVDNDNEAPPQGQRRIMPPTEDM